MTNQELAPYQNLKLPDDNFNFETLDGSMQSNCTVILAVSAVLLMGTGSLFAISQTVFQDVSAPHAIVTVVGSPAESNEVAEHQEMLKTIRTGLSLTMTDLASVFGISRPALYGWFQGSTPRSELYDRLWSLSTIAEAVSVLQIPRVSSIMRVPLASGRSFLQMISDPSQDLKEAVDQLRKFSEKRSSSLDQLRAYRGKRINAHAEEASIPFSECE